MANEIRLRANNLSGTITNNPLAIGGTSISSPGFVDLPTVDTTNHLLLILDPLETAGAAEIVQVTTHAAASSTVTVVRGFDTTTPRQHNLGVTWFHGPVVSDWNYTQRAALSSQRPVGPFTGELIYETDTARWTAWNGTAWLPAPHNVPTCRVFNNAAIVCPDAVETLVTFNSERFDTDSMHSTSVNTSRLTVNVAGVYLFIFNGLLATAADYAQSYSLIRLNGSTVIAYSTGDRGTAGPLYNVSTLYKCVVGDYVETLVFHDNAANAARNLESLNNSTPEFSAAWIGVG